MKLLKKNRRWRRARLHFWLYVDPEVLDHFFRMVREGRLGRIERAEGHSQDRLGRPLTIRFEKARLTIAESDAPAEPGWLEIEGDFTNEDLIQMRNHTVFHLRGFFEGEDRGLTA